MTGDGQDRLCGDEGQKGPWCLFFAVYLFYQFSSSFYEGLSDLSSIA